MDLTNGSEPELPVASTALSPADKMKMTESILRIIVFLLFEAFETVIGPER
jgi:hypothetical protein